MSLSYFTIFNPSLGPDEETLPNQLLFYTSAVVSDLDSQLRNIGLVQGIIELGRSFSAKEHEPINFIKSKDTRSYLLELEEGFWSILCLDVVSDDGLLSKDIPATNQVLLQMRNAYQLFTLEHGKFKDLLKLGRKEAIKMMETWWMRWSWSWSIDVADAALLFDGYTQIRVRPTQVQLKEMTEFRGRLAQLYPECYYDLLCMHEQDFMDSSDQTSIETKRLLQLYMAQFYDLSSSSGSAISTKADDAPAPEDGQANSWLSGKRWTDETSRLLGAFSIGSKSSAAISRNEQSVDGPALEYNWLFTDDKRLYLQSNSRDGSLHKYLNVLCYKHLRFLLILKVPGERERALVREYVEANISHLAVSLSQVSTVSSAAPPFFSLLHDLASGQVMSTLPSIAAAHVSSKDNSPLQVSVKINTIHLHRQIYSLMASPARQSCVKTAKNIWILMRRDDKGTVILAKSSKSGETMEEIEHEGQRWMIKLRKQYAL